MLKRLPADPDEMNEDRAAWAGIALTAFMQTTGTDRQDALSDLLCDLMHLCDRTGESFKTQLARAKAHYKAETRK